MTLLRAERERMQDDTAIGGVDARFPATRMSVVEQARSSDPEERRIAFDTLVRGYWKRPEASTTGPSPGAQP